MANRKRKIVLRVPVTAEEQAMIQQKMALLHTAEKLAVWSRADRKSTRLNSSHRP